MSDTIDPLTNYLLRRVEKLERENDRLLVIAAQRGFEKPTPMADAIRERTEQLHRERDFTPLRDWWFES